MCIEREVERPLQWLVCFLHMLELPGRALFWKLDGGTSGPVCTFLDNFLDNFRDDFQDNVWNNFWDNFNTIFGRSSE